MNSKERIYLDHAATTPLKKEVLDAMMPYFIDKFGNASSVHAYGRESRKVIEDARQQVADAIGADTNAIYFTSGATEADNWAVRGYAYANQKKGKHIITSTIEHHAVLHVFEELKSEGFDVTFVPVDDKGVIRMDELEKAMREDTILVSIMMANNEIGTIQPVKEIGALCHEHGVAFHTDAVQAIGAVPVDVKDMNIDMLSLSAHKMYGPKGVGALYVKKGIRLKNLIIGGAHEKGKRPGTYNHVGIVGLGAAIELAVKNMESESKRIATLRDKLIDGIVARIPEVVVNGHREMRLPNNVNISFKYIEGEALLLSLDLVGIAASSGSACTSGSLDPSHVLLAIGLDHATAHGSLRLTLGHSTTEADIERCIDELCVIVERLRKMSPLYNG